MSYIRWLDDIGAADADSVGGKAASLAETLAADLPVPPGFCLTVAAYHDFWRATGLDEAIGEILNEHGSGGLATIPGLAGRIRELVRGRPVPAGIAQETRDAYRRLGQTMGLRDATQVPVVVRCSAIAEDLSMASFASQEETYRNIRSEAALLDRVRDCWASPWIEGAMTHRQGLRSGYPGVAVAVAVQAMIPSAVSGILFMADPTTGRRDKVVVNAGWGLGEAIVSGLVTPDIYTVLRDDRVIAGRHIATKMHGVEYGEEGELVERAMPAGLRELPALSDSQVLELVALGENIEACYGLTQNVEWAYAHGRFYILQAQALSIPRSAPKG